MRAQDILRAGADTYEQKNRDYGASWKAIGRIVMELSHGEPIVIEDEFDAIAFGLFTRRLDKLARSFNAEMMAHTVAFESAVDSDEDESVYASMQAENKHDRQRVVADGGEVDPHPWDPAGYDAAYAEEDYLVGDEGVVPEYEEFYQNVRAGGDDE